MCAVGVWCPPAVLLLVLSCLGNVFVAGSDSQSQHISGAVVELTQANLNEYLRQGPLLVEFYADWHKACQQFESSWRSLAQELAGKLTVGRINFNEERELTERFGVATLPTFKFLYGNGIAVDYRGDLNATQLASYGLALLSPPVLPLEDVLRFTVPYSAFVLFHEPHDLAAMEAFVAGVRPFVESAGVLFGRSHSLQSARALLGVDVDKSAADTELPPLPFVAVLKDWDRPDLAPSSPPPVRALAGVGSDTRALVAFFDEHWMPLLPRIEAATFPLRKVLEQPDAIGLVIAVGPRADPPPASSELLDAVRQVAHEHHQAHLREGTTPRLAFAWVDGHRFASWLAEFGLSEAQFGSHAFVFNSLRESYYPAVAVRSADDLRSYLQRIQSRSVKALRFSQPTQQAKKDRSLSAVVEDWMKLLELPDWWRPSQWSEAVMSSPTARVYLSLAVGVLLAFGLKCVSDRLWGPAARSTRPAIAKPDETAQAASASVALAPGANRRLPGSRRRQDD